MRTMIFVEKVNEPLLEKLKAAAPGWNIVACSNPADYMDLLPEAEILSGWNEQAVEICLKPGTKLRWVHSWGAGVNSLPLERFQERGVFLTNASGVHGYPISETVFAMMLSLTRKLHIYMRQQVNGEWKQERNPLEMHGKTVGILGTGHIGQEIARLAGAFGMKTLGFSRHGQAVPGFDAVSGEEAVPGQNRPGLQELLAASDYVVNTLPLTKETAGMIGRDELARMKETAFYINIGRGGTTVTEALLEALQQKRIAGAGLDVFEQEPLPKDSPLWQLENVILTPHTSGMTGHYAERATDIFLTDLKDYLAGRAPSVNLVDLELGY